MLEHRIQHHAWVFVLATMKQILKYPTSTKISLILKTMFLGVMNLDNDFKCNEFQISLLEAFLNLFLGQCLPLIYFESRIRKKYINF